MSGVVGMRQHRRVTPLAERFWSKVDVGEADDCWEWQGARNPRGYGKLGRGRADEGTIDAHRASVYIATGVEPAAQAVVMHSCDNPPCVNPAHLSVGTYADNNRDTIAKGRNSRQRQTHCKSGHPFSPDNTFQQGNGSRGCRTCARQWNREYKERQCAA